METATTTNILRYSGRPQRYTHGSRKLRLTGIVSLLLLIFFLTGTAPATAQQSLSALYTPSWLTGGGGPPATANALWKVALPGSYAARCGDGSLPAFYVRAASALSAHPNHWAFHMPGGGSSADPNALLAMWLGVGHKGPQGPTHLSNQWARDSKPAQGIHSASAANPFADFNHVFIEKCTTDLFTGSVTAVMTTTRDITDLPGLTPFPAGTTYKVEFRGRQIIEDVIDYLLTGVTYTPTSGAGTPVAMPLLSNAVAILWTGSSGGGRSAIHSADAVAALIQANAPNAQVRLVADAAFGPGAELLDDHHHPTGSAATSLYEGTYTNLDPQSGTSPDDYYAGEEWNTFQTWGAGHDVSCLTYHAVSNDQWKCTDEIHVLMHHVTTPFFVRQDRQDPNATDKGTCWKVDWRANPGDCYYSARKFSQLLGFQMQDVLLQPTSAEEATSMTAAPAGFAPRCRQHVGLTNNAAFFRHGITGSGGVEHDFVDMLGVWFQTGQPGILVEPTVSGSLPLSCN